MPFILALMATSCLLLAATLTTPLNSPTYAPRTMKLIKLALLLNLASSLCLHAMGLPTLSITIPLHTSTPIINIGLMLDKYTALFMPTMTLITLLIMKFSTWYMATDPQLNKFIKYLILFLLAMITLLTADSLLQLFIGWEAVGIMSFLLISWWYARVNAITAGLQAVLYNRLGDAGFLTSMAAIATTLETWDMHLMFHQPHPPTIALLGLILAAMTKSAQLGAHPWLLAAMEGPTPVSALLHSSTMVIAGVFLLIRLRPWLAQAEWAPTTCLCLGTLTALFAAKTALMQFDMKKIIALSTLSQLGLMMATLGLNQPHLALLHIVTHAFFKALLFLCAGSISHSLAGEQDIRKMGGLHTYLPITSTCMTLANLALTGTPFLTAFYSKDPILELMNTSTTNTATLTTLMIATALTAAYSLRMTFYIHLYTPRHNPPLTTTSSLENNPNQTIPLMWLALASTTMGPLAVFLLPPYQQPTTMPLATKLFTPLIIILALIFTLGALMPASMMTPPRPMMLKTAFALTLHYHALLHRILPYITLTHGRGIIQLKEKFWLTTTMTMSPYKLLRTMLEFPNFSHVSTLKTHLTALLMFSALIIHFMA